MSSREYSLLEIENRIIRDKDIIGLKALYRNNPNLISSDKVPVVNIVEGDDDVEQCSSRSSLSFRRVLEIDIQVVSELLNDKGSSIKDLFFKVRRAIFCNKDNNGNYYVDPHFRDYNSSIFLKKSTGPISYEVPGLIGMIMIVGLKYIDNEIINF